VQVLSFNCAIQVCVLTVFVLLLLLRPGWKIYGFNRGECNGKTGIWFREW
jgi:hypothetical protein